MAAIVLHRLDAEGADLLSALLAFEGPDHFYGFPHERGPAVSANARVLEALSTAPDRFGPQRRKATDFLLATRSDLGCWHDKWHISPYYATAQAVFALGSAMSCELRTTYDWLLGSQHANGSWGYGDGTAEETSYAVLTLAALEQRHGPAPQEVQLRPRDWLGSRLDDVSHPELWIGKALYAPTTVVRAAVLAGFTVAHRAAQGAEDPPRPLFWTRFPQQVSPHADSVEAHTRAWRDRHGLVPDPIRRKRLDRTCVGRETARAFPHSSHDMLTLAADAFTWLTAFDDMHAEAVGRADPRQLARTLADFTRILDRTGAVQGNHRACGDGFPAALAELTARAERLLPRSCLTRFDSALRSIFFSLLWEAHRLWGDEPVPMDEYMTMRRHTVFATIITALVPRPSHALLTPDMHRLETAVHNLVGWINDLCSFSYEHGARGAPQSNPFSLPDLLMRHTDVTTDEALGRVTRMCDDEAAVAHRLISRLARSPDHEVRAWADAMAQLVSSTDFHVRVGRYG
ncbi:hypothetical protein P2Q00_42185 [Streptomyces coacervatus]|nr:hypothetical protein [Streptomyces coacervatus]MDF2271978.1 hypothetical protein [Streptomyces coacervatus]